MNDWRELNLKEHGFYGYFMEGKEHADKAIICMSGSDGKKEIAMESAEDFLAWGYSVLVLGFHGWEGLPQEKSCIPVEYVERAVDWLLTWENGRICKVGIKGASMGAQYALLCASLIPKLSLVIAAAPYDYVLECVDDKFRRTGHSTYSWHVEEVPYCPSVLLDQSIPGLLWKCAWNKRYGLKRMFLFYYDHNPLTEEGRIKVEHMQADVLLLASVMDDCWPAEESARRVEEFLKKNNYQHRIKAVIYGKGSHAIGSVFKNEETRKMMQRLLPTEKKYPQECEAARVDSVKQMKEFLEAW